MRFTATDYEETKSGLLVPASPPPEVKPEEFHVDLRCPRCGSTSIETTTMGFSGGPLHDRNKATCCKCNLKGHVHRWTAFLLVLDALRPINFARLAAVSAAITEAGIDDVPIRIESVEVC